MSEERISRTEIIEERRRFIRTRLLLTVNDAAAILAVTPRTVKNLIDEGKLPRINEHKNSGRTRITAADLDAYITSITET